MSSPFFSAEHWGANHAGKNTINIFLFLVISSIVFDNFKFKTFGVLYELLSILFLRNFLKHLADMFYHLYRLFPFPDDKDVCVCSNKTEYKCYSNEKISTQIWENEITRTTDLSSFLFICKRAIRDGWFFLVSKFVTALKTFKNYI